ncbi:carbohydrate-binding protein [Pseudoflavitalea rhizosphaerae]|uniref:carbohydrate-binding protein n=1 Tax=Pseudoflavitalea rhizosphaerae TaxID=1884793 RepID=UPI000F8E9B55|nr:carbohydrate-binding protein [Pseudoflavitalea rhizosphaerae]
MKNLLILLLCIIAWSNNHAQYILIDDMEGNGPGSGKWIYNAGANATGTVVFNATNPAPSGVNPSSQVAKFTKDTTCSPYMAASCSLPAPLDLSAGATFRMRVYSNVREEVLFKLQPGSDYTQAVFKTYRIQNLNTWEEVEFTFTGINHRTDLNRITIQFIDGKKANGILYFDHIEAPNPTSIRLTSQHIPMGNENGKTIEVKITGDIFKTVIEPSHWHTSALPPGVTVSSILRMNDSIVNIQLGGNSPANYSTTTFRLSVDSAALQNPKAAAYTARGAVIFDGNPAWTMIYNDEFDYTGQPDPTKWTTDPRPKGWINSEQQVYTDSSHDNARVRNGNLVITGKKNYPTGDPAAPWSSARVISLGKMEFLYGKAEMRAKLPRARGSWPAFWLMPTTNAYGNWPKSGEIDILEHVGNNFGKAMCAVHTENKNWTNGGNLGGNQIIPDLDTAYHVYGVEWSPDSLRFTHDGIGFYTYVNPHTDWKDWPFDKPFYVILNIAMGGGMGGTIVDADWPDSMLVDYVRISQKGLGTPYPDSISVSPSNISVLPGKAQQFTAKVLDQNGHLMPGITPTWSISGNGNTIDTNGLAQVNSSGLVTAITNVDTFTVQGSTNINIRPVNYKPVPARIEAEDFDNSNGGRTETTADTSGVLNLSYIGNGSWYEYDLDVPDSSAYRIRFRVAVSTPSRISIYHDTTELGTVTLPSSGGWQQWMTVTSAPVVFGPGQKTIRVQSHNSGWNFNWLQIVPASDHAVSAITVQPDSARIFTGGSIQLTALGYDADSNYIMLSPAASWHTGAGAAVNSSGLFSSDSVGLFTVTASSGSLSGQATVNVLGTPALSRIAIVPDTLIVPVGASQQFEAKGYDQYDTQVPLTDTITWSANGSQNSITQTGLFTAGNIPGTFPVSASSAGITGTLDLKIGYTCTVNNRYEAESASSRAPGLTPVLTDDSSGTQHFEGVTTGKWFAYNNLKVPSAGKYNIRLRVSTSAPASIRIGHGAFTFRIIQVPSTGGAWQTISDTVTLPALSYTGIHGVSGSFRFNWFTIDNCAAAPPAVKLELSPDTVTMLIGESRQFTATGYDVNDQPVQLPGINFTVTGAGNSIDTAGLLTANAVPGTYQVVAHWQDFSDTSLVQLACEWSMHHEAESCAFRHSGPSLEACTDAGGGQNFTGLAPGHWFAYNTLNVPAAGLYRISFRVLTTAPASFKVGHSTYNFGIKSIPSTDGAWQTITDTITLPALTYTGIHVISGNPKFNWFRIDNCASSGMMTVLKNSTREISVSDNQLTVSPNPSAGNIVISTGNIAYREIKVYDMNGRPVATWPVPPGQRTIIKDISRLPSGIYLLLFQGSSGQQLLRLIRQ